MNKILTLLVLYNSQIAVCLGSAASLLMTFLFSMGFLPGLSRVSSWSLGSGCLTSLLNVASKSVIVGTLRTSFGEPSFSNPLSIFFLG